MFENEINYKLSALIDIAFLQKMQDIYAKNLGISCIILDSEGPVTKPTNFPSFCTSTMRSKQQSLNKCLQEENKWAVNIDLSEPFTIKTCHAGLSAFIIPIMFQDKHIATIIGGLVLTEDLSNGFIKNLAKKMI